jgi:hypothetical protein
VRTDLNTLLTALYVKIDDHLGRPVRTGRPPRLTDAELLTLAVAQALLGIRSEARWLRFLPRHLPGAFSYLPQQSGYNKRLRTAVPLLKKVIRLLALDTDLWTDATWVVDSTPVECGRSRETTKRSELAGWAGYGYCSSHSRFFWGLRLHLVCTPAGLPITWALANPKLDERQVLMAILDHDPSVLADRPGLLIIADKGYVSRELDMFLAERGVRLLRPSYRNRTPAPGRAPAQTRPPADRVGQRHPQRPARPRTARRPHHRRRHRPHRPTPARPDRRDLAQPRHRPARHPITDRVRPLIS